MFARAPYGKHIIEWFKDSLEEQRDKNDSLNAPEVYRGQGMALNIKDFLREVKEAREAERKGLLG